MVHPRRQKSKSEQLCIRAIPLAQKPITTNNLSSYTSKAKTTYIHHHSNRPHPLRDHLPKNPRFPPSRSYSRSSYNNVSFPIALLNMLLDASAQYIANRFHRSFLDISLLLLGPAHTLRYARMEVPNRWFFGLR